MLALLPACASSQVISCQGTAPYGAMSLQTTCLIETSHPHGLQRIFSSETLHSQAPKGDRDRSLQRHFSCNLPCKAVLFNAPAFASKAKADSTLRTSQAVPHPSTIRALSRLTSEVRRDRVHSTRYGRQRRWCFECGCNDELERRTFESFLARRSPRPFPC